MASQTGLWGPGTENGFTDEHVPFIDLMIENIKFKHPIIWNVSLHPQIISFLIIDWCYQKIVHNYYYILNVNNKN